MTTTYRDIGEALTKGCEHSELKCYADPVTGTPTGGYGHTGPEVRVGVTITQETEDTWLDQDWSKADNLVQNVLGAGWAGLAEHEKAAIVDFAFNTGCDPKWEIWSVLKARDTTPDWSKAVCDQLARFDKAHVHGQLITVPGLDRRRDAEIVCWKTGDTDLAAQVANTALIAPPSSGFLREVPTPPTPDAPKALAKTSLGLKISGLLAGSGGLAAKAFTPDVQSQVQNVHDTVVANTSVFGHFGPAIASVCGAGVVVVSAGALLVHVTQQQAART